ncbi:hypothetical protein [Cryobacterium psychrophilum]|uniref:Uncharacterized protein n=1 Tax=Cryobacterium psychrophilum TaxID=41988 RepID=A0A4Y8KRJ9_9MICO|nr:hypothetical protein [Cryobacterium psychrophilum]TDW31027.1 hypothetical protein EDD25_2815 [Cryobacterium psychrophilum]TFD80879.1 hypothetical protein E3T53_04465 [Cryobacterium psychrophilum]
MIPVSDQMVSAIADGSATSGWVGDLIVDGQVVLRDLEFTGELISDSGALVLTQGSLKLNYTDDLGHTIVPEKLTSWLMPFASFIDISYRVTIKGIFSKKVLRGRLKVIGVTDPQETRIRMADRLITVGSSVQIKVADLFYTTDLERFEAPSGPTDKSSVWAEIQRLTLLPLNRSVPDAAITRTVLYKENRLDAIEELSALIGGRPYITPMGEVSVSPFEWGSPVAKLSMGAGGRVGRASADDLTPEGICNKVSVRSWNDEQATVLAEAIIPTGPLRWGGGHGRVPYFLSSEFVTTQAQAQEWADRTLPLVSVMKAVTYTIQCTADPRLEVWDVIEFEKDGVTIVGRIEKITMPARGQMTLVVSVSRG